MNLLITGALALFLAGCGTDAPSADTTLVVSSDPELRRAVAELLPDIVRRSALDLHEPVRVERRSRAELEAYLREKLDEEMPTEEEAHMTRAYALLGMVPEDMELRALLLDVYTEQVAGFYDPEASTLFVLDDQPPETMGPLLVHELVHAIQDQTANLDSLTHKDRGNDRQAAAQAAIEGHATLIMLEHAIGQSQGREVDFSELPDFSAQLRPALEGVRAQYPALGSAPRVIQESILFPYLEGAGFVQALWRASGEKIAPFGPSLPQSTQQVLDPTRFVGPGDRDVPVPVTVVVTGPVLDRNTLGQLEARIFLEELSAPGDAASGWGGDEWALVGEGTGSALAWATVWDDVAARDRFAAAVRPRLGALPGEASLRTGETGGRPWAILVVGPLTGEVDVSIDGGPAR